VNGEYRKCKELGNDSFQRTFNAINRNLPHCVSRSRSAPPEKAIGLPCSHRIARCRRASQVPDMDPRPAISVPGSPEPAPGARGRSSTAIVAALLQQEQLFRWKRCFLLRFVKIGPVRMQLVSPVPGYEGPMAGCIDRRSTVVTTAILWALARIRSLRLRPFQRTGRQTRCFFTTGQNSRPRIVTEYLSLSTVHGIERPSHKGAITSCFNRWRNPAGAKDSPMALQGTSSHRTRPRIDRARIALGGNGALYVSDDTTDRSSPTASCSRNSIAAQCRLRAGRNSPQIKHSRLPRTSGA
jgi:hypothetical protein